MINFNTIVGGADMPSNSISIHPVTVAEAIKSGKVPSYRLGRRILVDVEEVLKAMRIQPTQGTGE